MSHESKIHARTTLKIIESSAIHNENLASELNKILSGTIDLKIELFTEL